MSPCWLGGSRLPEGLWDQAEPHPGPAAVGGGEQDESQRGAERLRPALPLLRGAALHGRAQGTCGGTPIVLGQSWCWGGVANPISLCALLGPRCFVSAASRSAQSFSSPLKQPRRQAVSPFPDTPPRLPSAQTPLQPAAPFHRDCRRVCHEKQTTQPW